MVRQFGSTPQSCRNTLVTHSMKEIFKIAFSNFWTMIQDTVNSKCGDNNNIRMMIRIMLMIINDKLKEASCTK